MKELIFKAKEKIAAEIEIREEIFNKYKNEIIVGFKNGELGIFTDNVAVSLSEIKYIHYDNDLYHLDRRFELVSITRKRTE